MRDQALLGSGDLALEDKLDIMAPLIHDFLGREVCGLAAVQPEQRHTSRY